MAGADRRNLLARLVTPGGDDPLLLTLVAPVAIRAGAAVSGIALVGKGGAGGYVYSIITGSLPTGLSLSGATGAITGTPTVAGNFSFVAQVQDSAASVYTASFSLRILSRLIRKHKAIRPGEIGLAYSFTFMVTGNTGAVRVLREGLTGGPTGATVAGGMAYVIEGRLNLRADPSKDPGPFRVIGVPYQAPR